MSDQGFTKCPYCGEVVDPSDASSVYAVQARDLPGFGQAHDFVDGMGAYFHPACPPEAMNYQRRDRP